MSHLKFSHEIFSSTFLPFALHPYNYFGKVFRLNSFSKTLHFNHTILLVCKNAPSSLLTLTTFLSVQILKLGISYQTWVKIHSSLFTLTFIFSVQKLKLGFSSPPPHPQIVVTNSTKKKLLAKKLTSTLQSNERYSS